MRCDPARRRFLRLGGGTLAGAGLALGANPAATLARAADGALGDGGADGYRALVCVYLDGGCDGFSLLVPTGAAEHRAYVRSRGQLAVARERLLALPATQSGTVGLHPDAEALRPLYDAGRLAMIANVGNLVEPTTAEQYRDGGVALPAQLFSHSDQSIQWQQLQGRDRATDGWGALAASVLSGEHAQRDYLTSISLDGANYWQSGAGRRPFSMRESGVIGYNGLDGTSDWQRPRLDAFRRVLGPERRHVLVDAYRDLQTRAMDITAELGQVLEREAGRVGEPPADNPLAERLAMVARLIAARGSLGMRRQIFYVRMEGFDVHDDQNRDLPVLFGQLGEALGWFQGTLDGLGESDGVTTFTASDFGRALNGNGNGTDHGWGNHLMAMGGAVRGGTVHGTLPRLDVDGPDSVNNGRVLPTLAATQYAATLLGWLGLDDAQLATVLPTLRNFERRDLGFMA